MEPISSAMHFLINNLHTQTLMKVLSLYAEITYVYLSSVYISELMELQLHQCGTFLSCNQPVIVHCNSYVCYFCI